MSPATASCAARFAEFDLDLVRLMPPLRRKALSIARDRADAEDLVQETLVRAMRFWPSFSPGTNLFAWLSRIMVNTYMNLQRRRRLDTNSLHQSSQFAPSLHGAENELHRRVFSSLDDRVARRWSRLRQRDRQLLRLIHGLELSYEDVARTLSWPVGTVMSRVHRARRALSA